MLNWRTEIRQIVLKDSLIDIDLRFPLRLEVGAWGRAGNVAASPQQLCNTVGAFISLRERAPKEHTTNKGNRACLLNKQDRRGQISARFHREAFSDRPSAQERVSETNKCVDFFLRATQNIQRGHHALA